MLIYPYERTRAALDSMARAGKPHPAHGFKLRYANPANRQASVPDHGGVDAAAARGLSPGKPYRCTGSAVFTVHRGEGTARIGDKEFKLRPHDVFVATPWQPYQLHGRQPSSSCSSYSDRAGQEALGYWREQMD